MKKTVYTVRRGDHVLVVTIEPGQLPRVESIVYNTTPAEAHTILSRRRDLIVH